VRLGICILITAAGIALFIVAMVLIPRMKFTRAPVFRKGPVAPPPAPTAGAA
jgi:membrane protein CcdC involved in cytochrome C biogenesis